MARPPSSYVNNAVGSNVPSVIHNVWATTTNAASQTTAITGFHSNTINCTNSSGIMIATNNWGDSFEAITLLRKGIAIDKDRIVSLTKDDELIVTKSHKDLSSSKVPIPLYHQGVIKLDPDHQDFLPGTVIKTPDGTILKIDKDGGFTKDVIRNARSKVIDVSGGNATLYESLAFCHFRDILIPSGHHSNTVFTFPNGVKLKLYPDDKIEIDDSDGKQLYQAAPIRGFNKFLNASDLLEEFIGYCATQKVTQKDFSELPISLFIYWLIVRAAEADGDPTDEVVPLLTSAVQQRKSYRHRCKCCGRFLSKRFEDNNIPFCSSAHMDEFLQKKDFV